MVDLTAFSMIKQGAEARLYSGTFMEQKVIVKERFSKKYRHPELDKQLTKDRHKAEARALMRCKQIGVRAPTLYLCDNLSHSLVMDEMVGCTTARDFIDSALVSGDTGGLERLADLVGGTVGQMHLAGLIHGDITTSNMLVVQTAGEFQLVMIDFGLSFQEGVAEDKGVDLYVLERALLSTHPNTEHVFARMLAAYKKKLRGKGAEEVVEKFEEIRLRGRKRTMLG